jgi:hypothetical protein
LKLAEFERLLDRNPQIRTVELSNYGEMFLNPQLPELLACAFERQVVVSGSNGVNLNFASEPALEAVVKYRVRELTCSIDGATQETYARYRVNGNLDRVLAHVDRIRDLRRSAGAAFPLLNWQFVVMGHNEREIALARSMARSRGMQFIPRLTWSEDYSPVVDRDLVRIQTGLGAAGRDEFQEKKGVGYTRDLCYQLWHAPVINWDGRMLGCCVNYWGDFGTNVFAEGLDAAMRHPQMEYARRMLLGVAAPRPGVPCTTCDQYRAMALTRTWIREDELRISPYGKLLAGVVPAGAPECRFARISIEEGLASKPRFDVSGRLFRFAVDTAIYFHAPVPGCYTVFAQCLEAAGWGKASRHVFDVAPSPLCQEVRIDTRAGLEWDREAENLSLLARPLSHWIR